MSVQKALVAGASLFALAGVANAQEVVKTTNSVTKSDPRDDRIQALEQALADIQDQLADLKAGAAADTAEVRRVQQEAPVLDLKNGRPTFSTADGNFKVAIRGLFQADAAQYVQDDTAAAVDRRGVKDLSSGVNVRRARIGLEGTVYKDWNWALTYETGGSGAEAAALQQAWLEYVGFKPFDLPLRIKGGVFAAITGLEDATNNTDGVFVERAAIADLVRGVSGGDGRNGIGAFINGERWNAELVWTGGVVGNAASFANSGAVAEFDEQSGYIARIDGLLLKDQDYNLHVGLSANGIIQLPDLSAPGAAFNNAVQLRERPELRVDGTRLVDTASIANVTSVDAYGAELGFQYKNFLVAGEYFTIDIDRTGTTPDPDFNGWYAQASYTLTGEQRKWGAVTGGYGGIKPDKPFNLSTGDWGAWEIAARYSTLDLNFNEGAAGTAPVAANGAIRGGKQDITSLGLNFYPNSVVRFLLDYQQVDIDRLSTNTTTTAAANGFPAIPVGSQIGQDYQAITLRTQVAF